MNEYTVSLWLSAGKPVGAVAVKLLERDGLIELDAPVADYWPEFGQRGKESITTRHLLTHTAGIRTAEVAAGESEQENALSIIASSPIERDWIPGKRAGYHATAGWQVLGELVRRLGGSPYDEFVDENIFAPLDMQSSTFRVTPKWLAERDENIAQMYTSGRSELTPDERYSWRFTSAFPRPGGGLHSTASDMVRFYRMLLGFGELDGTRLLEPNEVTDILSPHRSGMKDETFGQVMDWGLGVMFDNKIHSAAAPYGYGEHASAMTFGHGGRESSIAFADPQNALVVALVFNGMPGEPTNDRRLRLVTKALYEDLGIA